MKKQVEIFLVLAILLIASVTIYGIGELLQANRIDTLKKADRDKIIEKTGVSNINITYENAICQDNKCKVTAEQEGLINTFFILDRYKNETSLEEYTNTELREQAEALTKTRLESYADALRKREAETTTKETSGQTIFNEE